ncbi:CUB domain-containing protein 1-like isoform X1 [Pantherophis guttatus]|uniref:CUB domain-containing protein 1 isoform X1 n=2 Tax=Pantherophis guttatus TaxID=94885 RepID=A0A6P9AN90_PANGU|nr:CUB domain-containing protein 1 isoform X1 [Pantherophis guttatus]XP_060541928.1 CUB domain-containing protein 1-like isoform X1 [Pantherophis guttatus]
MAAAWWVSLPLARLLFAAVLALLRAGAFEISLPLGGNITVKIKPGFSFLNTCALHEGKKTYFFEQIINPGQKFQFTFNCSTPEKYWSILVEKNIDCLSGPCPFGDVQLQPPGLPNLNRTFIWEAKANRRVGLELKFFPWLRQILPGDTCPDQIIYNIGSRLGKDRVHIGTFCRNGSVSRVKAQGDAILSLQLPWDSKLATSGVKLESRSSIQRLCIIESTFKGKSSATLMSANYPLGLPEDELMTWQFVLPSSLRADINFINYTKPNCERKYERVEYSLPNYSPDARVLSLDDVQPVNIPGSFNLSLYGCDQDDMKPGFLRLLFKVIVNYPKNEENVTYKIDLIHEKTNLTVYSKSSMNECLICVHSSRNCRPNVTLEYGRTYFVTFLCQNLENIRIIAEQSIVCWNARTCENLFFQLAVPSVLLQLPILIETFTWKIQALEAVNIEIRSSTLKLKQHIPNRDQRCNGSYSYIINGSSPGRSWSLGYFCPVGDIEKIQIKDNVTITLKTFGKRWFNESNAQKGDLKLFFKPVLQEDCIFTLSPDRKTKVYVQTPNWLEGLLPFMSVYWNISVLPKQVARLTFLNERMGITCEKSRAFIYIKEQSAKALETVCRDDNVLPRTLNLRQHFWINITNCKPSAKQQLSLQFLVTFQKNSDLTVIIGVVAGGMAVLAITGLLICYVKKKRKSKRKESHNPVVGVYNTNVNTLLPGRQGIFKKERKKNDSHVYAVIEDVMVYGHLLDNSTRPEMAEVGVYRPFSGPVSTTPPSPPPIRKISKSSDLQESSNMLVTDSEDYTFARHVPENIHNGDLNVNGNGHVGSRNNEQGNSVD